MKPILNVQKLSKKYILGSETDHTQSFREMLTGVLVSPFRRFKRLSGVNTHSEEFWALKDVSFTVNKGEILGIIGANGAGKSTLLKLLSRITSPTLGEVEYKGKLASLLEVGTGFHPELTGRENIYLNGAILGMSRSEVSSRFDKIVEFANVEQFLDTPVKRYSSGMYVRLAFSVAAHIDPDILIIDEVLAVGDAEFQRKCLDLMKTLSDSGHAVIFVSHNMDSVRALTTRCLLLENGQLQMDGETQDVINNYQQRNRGTFGLVHEDKNKLDLLEFSAKVSQTGKNTQKIDITIRLKAKVDVSLVRIDFAIDNENKSRIIQHVATSEQFFSISEGDTVSASYQTDIVSLLHGNYFGHLYIFNEEFGPIIHLDETKLFEIVANPVDIYTKTFTPIIIPKIQASIDIS